MGEMTEAEMFEHTQRVEQRRMKVTNLLYHAIETLRDVETLDTLDGGVQWTRTHNEALSAISMKVMGLLAKASK